MTTAALAIRNSLEAMQAANVARELSQKRLEAAQSKFEVGMSNNFEVLQAQRDLADARNRELRETLNYQRALVDFDGHRSARGGRRLTKEYRKDQGHEAFAGPVRRPGGIHAHEKN